MPGRTSLRSLAIGVGIGLVLAVIGGRLLAPSAPAESADGEAPVAAAGPRAATQTVTVAEAEVTSVQRTLAATGTANAFELLPVTAETGGLRIERVLVDEGEAVRAGQVLAVFDSSVLRAQRQQAIASVQQAEAGLAELRAGARVE
ncbi:MAG: biotin/lipoyl-binding protein, partial [Spirulinaceae cyanobacterium RM2_2_10]|nr:biotin/lipoyl-binding protein [Spirulinaceae cyanobacterium RM2_2_10]